jgi:biopolymer transport protein ExbD
MGAKVSEEQEPITDINVTPLVDVCLVLVIIFMVTANFVMQAGINVSHSSSGAAQGKTSSEENVNVILTKDGKIIINGKQIKREEMPAELNMRIARSKDKLVTIVPDNENIVADVVDVLDLSKQNGAEKLSIMKKAQN